MFQASKLHRDVDMEKDRLEMALVGHYGRHIDANNQHLKTTEQDYDDFMRTSSEALNVINDEDDVYVLKKGANVYGRLRDIEAHTNRVEVYDNKPSLTFRDGRINQANIKDMLGSLSSHYRPRETKQVVITSRTPSTQSLKQIEYKPMSSHSERNQTTPRSANRAASSTVGQRHQQPTPQRVASAESLVDSVFERGLVSQGATSGQKLRPYNLVPECELQLPHTDGIGYVYGIAPTGGDRAWVTVMGSQDVVLVSSTGNVIHRVDVGDIAEDVTGDGSGGCIVTCPRSKSIRHINGETIEVTTLIDNLPQDPHGICMSEYYDEDIQENFQELFISFTQSRGSTASTYDNQKGQIRIFTRAGECLGQIYCLESPVRLDVASESDSMVVCDHSNRCVLVTDKTGRKVHSLYTNQDGEAFRPLGVCFDGHGGVLVADWEGGSVLRMSLDGSRLGAVIGGVAGPQTLAMGHGRVWVGGRQGHVHVFNIAER